LKGSLRTEYLGSVKDDTMFRGRSRSRAFLYQKPGAARTDSENEQKMNHLLQVVHPAGNHDSDGKARPSRNLNTSHGLHVEGKSLFVTPIGDYVDRVLSSRTRMRPDSLPVACGAGGGRGQARRWGNPRLYTCRLKTGSGNGSRSGNSPGSHSLMQWWTLTPASLSHHRTTVTPP
jgi:hypothetical protein